MKFFSIVLAVALVVSFAGVATAGNSGHGSKATTTTTKGTTTAKAATVSETTPSAHVVTVATDANATMIEACERKMVDCYKTHDNDTFANFVDPNCWMGGPNGFMPATVVAGNLGQYALTNYAVANFKTYCINPSTYFTTYTYTCNGTYNGKECPSGPYYCSSVWTKRGNDWKVAYHQESIGTAGTNGFTTPTPTASKKPAGKH